MDLSKMDPKVLMELSQLVQQLPPHQLGRMQSLMHNMMAGFDVSKDMEEFEKSLPPGFREKMASLLGPQAAMFGGMGAPGGAFTAPSPAPAPEPISVSSGPMDLSGARLTILRAVADGGMSPEDAERLLFPQG